MTKSLADLLAMDAVASRHGCALKPKLRAAIEADLRFPAHATAPRPETELTVDELPENVLSLSAHSRNSERKRA